MASQENAISPPSASHSLIPELDRVRHRYDDLQRAFRDCHLILKDLINSISSISPVTEIVAILRTAVQRLDDFNEDARVELEIRITDEELSARGFQTLLNVPGAISDDSHRVRWRMVSKLSWMHREVCRQNHPAITSQAGRPPTRCRFG